MDDNEYEELLFKTISQLGRHWIRCIEHPSMNMTKKHPILASAQSYIYEHTTCLNDSAFAYTLTTRLVWLKRHFQDFPKCQSCGKPIKHWNVPTLSDCYKSTCSKACERAYAAKHAAANLLAAHGVRNAFQLEDVKVKLKAQKEQTLNKCYLTRKANHTFKTSKLEDNAHELLKQKFQDVVRQHRSDAYPFFCDFYVPSQDLYIECNFTWTHGGRPYIADDVSCQCQLAEWTAKNSQYYRNAIETWTVRDVKKRNAGKMLNWKELWTLEELKKWLSKK